MGGETSQNTVGESNSTMKSILQEIYNSHFDARRAFQPPTKNFMTAHNDLKVATTPVQHSFETDTRSLNGVL